MRSPIFNPNQHLPALTRAARGLPELPGGVLGSPLVTPLPRGVLPNRKAAESSPGNPIETQQ